MSISVTIKQIKGESFNVDIEETATVADLKKKISEAKPGDFPPEAQKLIFTGKILQDDAVINTIGLKPDSFIVAMVSVTKPAGAAAPAAAPAANPTPTGPPAAQTPAAPTTAPNTAPPAPRPLPEVLTNLKNYPKWPELARMVASNPGKLNQMLPALERWPEVRTAIVDDVQGFVIMCRVEAGVHETTPMPQLQVGGGGRGGAQMAAALAQELRQNPEMMQQLMQELPPEMRQMAQQNPEQLAAMIAQSMAGGGPGGPGAGGGGGGMPVPIPAEISEADNAAIDRLVALGFDKAIATQAYFACDKNEELAANFLFDGGGDDPMGTD